MAQIQKGHTYNTGDIVDAPDLNAHVDNATALAGLITDVSHGVVTATAGDKVLVSRVGVLKQADVGTFPAGVTTVGLTMPTSEFTVTNTTPGGPTVSLGVAWKSGGFSANKVLAAPPSSSGAPSFRVLTAADVSPLHSDIAAFTIDWSLGNVFAKTMPDNGIHHFGFTNVRDGQSIMVRVQQFGSGGGIGVAHWDNVDYWRAGGTEPVLTTGLSAKDIYFFTAIGSAVYGYSHQNFA